MPTGWLELAESTLMIQREELQSQMPVFHPGHPPHLGATRAASHQEHLPPCTEPALPPKAGS